SGRIDNPHQTGIIANVMIRQRVLVAYNTLIGQRQKTDMPVPQPDEMLDSHLGCRRQIDNKGRQIVNGPFKTDNVVNTGDNLRQQFPVIRVFGNGCRQQENQGTDFLSMNVFVEEYRVFESFKEAEKANVLVELVGRIEQTGQYHAVIRALKQIVAFAARHDSD